MSKICGIYKLEFAGTDKVYIGLSKDITSRYTTHIRSMKDGTCSKKLLHAYQTYGMPTLSILEEVPIDTLELKEVEYIEKYNSIENGFNTLLGSPVYAVDRGFIHGDHDKSEYEIMFLAIYEARLKYGYSVLLKDIASKLEVSESIITQIACCRRHQWLKNVYPEECRFLEETVEKYTYGAHSTGATLGIVYPTIQDKFGKEYTIGDNLSKFCKEHNLDNSAMARVLCGAATTHKGFRLLSTPLPRKWVITNGLVDLILIEREIPSIVKPYNLDTSSIIKLINGKKLSHKGWVLKMENGTEV